MKDTDFENLHKMLRGIYPEAKSKALYKFARVLEKIVDDTNNPLVDCIINTTDFEETLENKPEYSEEDYVFSSVLDYLDVNEDNAARLYKFFTQNLHDFNVFTLLVTSYEEFLSKKAYDNAVAIGKKCFDGDLLVELINLDD